jgi:hypothetical protein
MKGSYANSDAEQHQARVGFSDWLGGTVVTAFPFKDLLGGDRVHRSVEQGGHFDLSGLCRRFLFGDSTKSFSFVLVL